MIVRQPRLRGYRGFAGFGAHDLFPGVTFKDDWVAEHVLSMGIPQGYMHDENSAPVAPFPSDLMTAVQDALNAASAGTGGYGDQSHQQLAQVFVSSAQQLVNELNDHPPHSGNVMGIGDTDSSNDALWRSSLKQLIQKSQDFINNWNKLPLTAAPSLTPPASNFTQGTSGTTFATSPPAAAGGTSFTPAPPSHHMGLILGLVGGVLLLGGVGTFFVVRSRRRSAVAGYSRRRRRR